MNQNIDAEQLLGGTVSLPTNTSIHSDVEVESVMESRVSKMSLEAYQIAPDSLASKYLPGGCGGTRE